MTLRVSADKAELDVPLIHRFLSEHSGWAKGISLPIVTKALEQSLCFGGRSGVNMRDSSMRKSYDFSKSTKNPYARRLKRQITIRLDAETIRNAE